MGFISKYVNILFIQFLLLFNFILILEMVVDNRIRSIFCLNECRLI